MPSQESQIRATFAQPGVLRETAEETLEASISRGSIIVGGVGGAMAELSAKTSGRVLVGDGTDLKSVAVSGDATLAASGALTLAVPRRRTQVTNILVTAFTDNANTTGYLDLAALPAKCIILGWQCVTRAGGGFAGDTTATMQLGVAGTLDKYSAVTNGSVFAAAATIGAVCKTTGIVLELAAVTPRVTVTTTADFTTCKTQAGGNADFTIYYIEL